MRLLFVLVVLAFHSCARVIPRVGRQDDALDQCATRNYKKELDGRHEEMLASIMSGETELNKEVEYPVTIDVWFHVVSNNTDKPCPPGSPKDYSNIIPVHDGMIQAQVDILNKDYAHTGLFQFKLAGITYNKRSWKQLGAGSPEESVLKSDLRKGDRKTLNIYATKLTRGLLGWATFPQDYQQDPTADGVVMSAASMPGGNLGPYSKGRTGTHEVGHWLGLYHVFQEYCSYPNDFVHDTPPQNGPSSGCPIGRKSCNKDHFLGDDLTQYYQSTDHRPEVVDSVTNFMDYSHDNCMTAFTPGQIERMKLHWEMYRHL